MAMKFKYFLIFCLYAFDFCTTGSISEKWVHPGSQAHDVIAQNYAQFHRRNRINSIPESLRKSQPEVYVSASAEVTFGGHHSPQLVPRDFHRSSQPNNNNHPKRHHGRHSVEIRSHHHYERHPTPFSSDSSRGRDPRLYPKPQDYHAYSNDTVRAQDPRRFRGRRVTKSHYDPYQTPRPNSVELSTTPDPRRDPRYYSLSNGRNNHRDNTHTSTEIRVAKYDPTLDNRRDPRLYGRAEPRRDEPVQDTQEHGRRYPTRPSDNLPVDPRNYPSRQPDNSREDTRNYPSRQPNNSREYPSNYPSRQPGSPREDPRSYPSRQPDNFREDPRNYPSSQPDNSRQDPRNYPSRQPDNSREDPRNYPSRQPDSSRQDPRNYPSRQPNNSREDPRNYPSRQPDNSREDLRNYPSRQPDSSREDPRNYPSRQPDNSREDPRNYPSRQPDNSREDPRNYPTKQPDNSREDPRNYPSRQPDNSREDPRNYPTKQPDNSREDPRNYPSRQPDNSREDPRNYPTRQPEHSREDSRNYPTRQPDSSREDPRNTPPRKPGNTHEDPRNYPLRPADNYPTITPNNSRENPARSDNSRGDPRKYPTRPPSNFPTEATRYPTLNPRFDPRRYSTPSPRRNETRPPRGPRKDPRRYPYGPRKDPRKHPRPAPDDSRKDPRLYPTQNTEESSRDSKKDPPVTTDISRKDPRLYSSSVPEDPNDPRRYPENSGNDVRRYPKPNPYGPRVDSVPTTTLSYDPRNDPRLTTTRAPYDPRRDQRRRDPRLYPTPTNQDPRRKCEKVPPKCFVPKHNHDPRNRDKECKYAKKCEEIIKAAIAKGKQICQNKPFFLVWLPKESSGTSIITQATTTPRPYTYPTTLRPYRTTDNPRPYTRPTAPNYPPRREYQSTARPTSTSYWPTQSPYRTTERPYRPPPREYRPMPRPYDPRYDPRITTTPAPYYPRRDPRLNTTPVPYTPRRDPRLTTTLAPYYPPREFQSTPRPYRPPPREYQSTPRPYQTTQTPYWPTQSPYRTTERPYRPPPREYQSTPRPYPKTPTPYRPTPSPYTTTERPYWTTPRTEATSYWTPYRPNLTTPRYYTWTPYIPHGTRPTPSWTPYRPGLTTEPAFNRRPPDMITPRPDFYTTKTSTTTPVPKTTTQIPKTTTQISTTTVSTTTKFTYCLSPQRPENGLVVCDEDTLVAVEDSLNPGSDASRTLIYPSGTICRYFCIAGYELSTEDPNEGVVVCAGSKWNETLKAQCQTSSCPKAPNIENTIVMCSDKSDEEDMGNEISSPRRGDISLEDADTINGKYRSDSSTCTYRCQSEYLLVIPDASGDLNRAKMIDSWTIECKPPAWNITDALPQCIPRLEPIIKCQDPDSVVVLKGQWKDNLYKLPVAYSADSPPRRLKTKCSTKTKTKRLGPRVYTCNTTDSFYGTSAFCKFKVNVVGQCPEPPAPPVNGSITCDDVTEDFGNVGPILHTVGSNCHFACDSGSVIPASQSELEVITCNEALRWSNTQPPTCAQQIPPETPTCDNVPPDNTDPELLVAPDYFSSFSGKKLDTTCSVSDETGNVLATFKDQMKLSSLGIFDIICEAYDPDLDVTNTCNYTIKALDVEVPLDEFTTFNSEPMIDASSSTEDRELVKLDDKCPDLLSPANGDLECDPVTGTCVVTCDEFHTLHSPKFSGRSKRTMTIECLKDKGKWSFMESKDSPPKLPDCLRELPRTSLEVVLGFNVTLPSCGDNEQFINKTQTSLISKNVKSCPFMNCHDWNVQCWENVDYSIISFKWTAKASFDPKEYESVQGVPEAETLIEQVISETKKTVTQDDDFRDEIASQDRQLVPNSFHQSKFRLVCDSTGFAVEKETDMCVECSSGTYHDGGEDCLPCPFGTYQDGTGAIECKPCTETKAKPNATGARLQSEC